MDDDKKPTQPSGWSNEKYRRNQHEKEDERERNRLGLNQDWRRLLTKIGQPPLDPVENSEWANNLAAGMAHIIARDTTIPLPERFKKVCEMIDRIGYTQPKASVAKRIREIKESAGIMPAKVKQDAVQVGGGSSLRAGGDTRGGGTVS